jgi:hypothetical protein
MTYRFAGFFVAQRIECPASLPEGAAWREISRPFAGTGVRLPEFLGKSPSAAEVSAAAERLGLCRSDTWLYLTCDCWGGQIDFVYGLGSKSRIPFGPVEEDAQERVIDAYCALFQQLDVSRLDALNFEPFQRGFWGER